MASINTQGSTVSNPNAGLMIPNPVMSRVPIIPPATNSQYQSVAPMQTKIPGIPGLEGGVPLNKGLLETHTPSTAVKSMTDASGNKVDFHTPTTNTIPENTNISSSGTGTSSSNTNPGMLPITPNNSAPIVGTPTNNAQNVLNQANLVNNPEYQQLAQQQNALVQGQKLGSTAPFSGAGQSLGQSQADLNRPQTTANLAGEEANFNNQSGIALSGNAAQEQALLSGAQLATGGAENVLGASLYSPTAYGQTNTSGLTGVQAGQFGSGPQAAANVATIQANQTAINTINQAAPAADAAFSVLNNYAQGIGANTPITSGLTQLYGSTAQGSQAVAGFQAQLQAVRSAWQAIEGGDPTAAIPDNVTPSQLSQIQQQLKTDSQNKLTSYQNQNNNLMNSSNALGGFGWNG